MNCVLALANAPQPWLINLPYEGELEPSIKYLTASCIRNLLSKPIILSSSLTSPPYVHMKSPI